MARQSIVAGELSSIFGDLAKIAMSNTANKRAQELQLETNLIEMEVRQLASQIATTEADLKNKQELFRASTGEAFKLSDESKTAGYEKFSSSITDPMISGYEDKINADRQKEATLKSQLSSINELLQGPLADITSFYKGAADPAFDPTGDPNIIEASDMTPEALDAHLKNIYGEDIQGGKYLEGAKAKISVNTALQQLEVQKISSDVNLALIQNQNSKTIAEAESKFATIEGNQKNIDSGKRVLNSFIDSDILVNSISDVSLLEQVALNAQSVYADKNLSTNLKLRDDAQAKLYNEYYEIGAALKGQEEMSQEDYIEAFGEEAAEDMIAHGLQYYDAIKSTQSTTAKKGTNIPTINILLESYEGFLKDNPDTNWDKIEEITGYTQDMFERNVPIMRDGLEAIRVAEASNAALLPGALTGIATPAPIVNEPDSTDPTDINRVEDEDFSDYQAEYEASLVEALASVNKIPYYNSPFDSEVEIDPFEVFSADLDFSSDVSAENDEEYYESSAPKEYNALRARVNRKEELLSTISDATRIRDEISPTDPDFDMLSARIGAERMRKEAQEEYDAIERREHIGSATGMNLLNDLNTQIVTKEKQNKDIQSFSRTWSNGDPVHLENLIKELGVESDTALYSIPGTQLAEAIAKLEGYYNSKDQNISQGNSPINPSQRNNNPGNLKYAGQTNAIGTDADGFAIFENEEDGFEALINQIELNQLRSEKYWSDPNHDRRAMKSRSDIDFMDEIARLFPNTL